MRDRSEYRTVNGLRLFVHRFRDEAIPRSGLTLLMLHGYMDAGATWDLVAEPLARAGHEVIAPDLRGFGKSEWIGAGGYYHFPDYVTDVAALVAELSPARLGVVGHSMGGTVAALYAGAFPKRVERLALLEGVGPPPTEPVLAVDRLLAWLRDLSRLERTPRAVASIEEAAERLALNHPRVPRAVLESRAQLLTRRDEEGRIVWSFDPLHRTTSPTPFNVHAFNAFLSRIACPMLFVSGGPSGWHPPDEDARLAHVGDLRRVELETAGHMMHWSAPLEVADHLLRFFGDEAP